MEFPIGDRTKAQKKTFKSPYLVVTSTNILYIRHACAFNTSRLSSPMK